MALVRPVRWRDYYESPRRGDRGQCRQPSSDARSPWHEFFSNLIIAHIPPIQPGRQGRKHGLEYTAMTPHQTVVPLYAAVHIWSSSQFSLIRTVACCDLSWGAPLVAEAACEDLMGSSRVGPAQVVDQALDGSGDQDVHQVVDLVGDQFEPTAWCGQARLGLRGLERLFDCLPGAGDADRAVQRYRPTALRRRPNPASTLESEQVRHQVLRLPREPAAAQVSGEDRR
jgi:hypothetical protein